MSSPFSVYNGMKIQVGKNQTDAKGKPIAPAFSSVLGRDGLLREPYQLGDGGYDPRAMDALRTEAFRQGPSTWRTLQQGLQTDALAKNQAGQFNQGVTRMASTGGISTGARERMMQKSLEQGLTGRQNINSSLALADEENRQKTLQALPGQELQLAGFKQGTQQYNIDKALGDIFQKRAFDANAYNEQMRAWAAKETAKATPSSGKK